MPSHCKNTFRLQSFASSCLCNLSERDLTLLADIQSYKIILIWLLKFHREVSSARTYTRFITKEVEGYACRMPWDCSTDTKDVKTWKSKFWSIIRWYGLLLVLLPGQMLNSFKSSQEPAYKNREILLKPKHYKIYHPFPQNIAMYVCDWKCQLVIPMPDKSNISKPSNCFLRSSLGWQSSYSTDPFLRYKTNQNSSLISTFFNINKKHLGCIEGVS